LDLFPTPLFPTFALDPRRNSRMLSATCLDPNDAGLGSPDYVGEWAECAGGGDGTSTPWGYVCQGNPK
ncbi:hypothetical protein THAOC_17807, partial [Thalassiosira oceanica]